MNRPRPHVVSLLALAGLAPVAYYLVGTGSALVAAALVNVVLIALSLYWMTSPDDAESVAGT